MSWLQEPHVAQITAAGQPGPNDYVQIFHPRSPNPLISLPATDFLDKHTGRVWVLELGVALDVAFIISNNSLGYFSASRDPNHRLSPELDYLKPGRYFYFMLDMSDSYAVVSSFVDWTPPTDLPPRWRAVQASENAVCPLDNSSAIRHLYSVCSSPQRLADNVLSRDGHACLVTRGNDALDCCHIIPRQHRNWFQHHTMWLHNPPAHRESRAIGDKRIDTVNNALTLRSDIHRRLDSGHFAFIVKGGRMVCHLFKLSSPYEDNLHGRAFPVPAGVPLQFLFARLAHTVFKRFYVYGYASLDVISGHPNAALPEGNRRRSSDDYDRACDNDVDAVASARSSDEIRSSDVVRGFAQRFPHLHEVTYSSDHDWHSLAYHPETVKMHRLREAWFEKHPNISATTGSTADLDDEAEFDDADGPTLDPDELSSDPYLLPVYVGAEPSGIDHAKA